MLPGASGNWKPSSRGEMLKIGNCLLSAMAYFQTASSAIKSSNMAPDATILSVDDNDAHRYFIVHTLEQAGFKVIQGRTATEALEKAAEHPDLVLLDVHLPDGNGFDVCRKLKANPATSAIPIVMFSSISQGGS